MREDNMHTGKPADSPNRFTHLTPDVLPATQRNAYDHIVARRGKLPQPYVSLLQAPALACAMEQLVKAVWDGSLDEAIKESVYLCAAVQHRCHFQWRSHLPKALAAGVSPAHLDLIREGTDGGASDALSTAIVFARQLLGQHHVDDVVFQAAGAALGTEGRAELCALCCTASTVALLLNVQDADAAS